jgi:uncharacterized protein YecT (DUF1311 family)
MKQRMILICTCAVLLFVRHAVCQNDEETNNEKIKAVCKKYLSTPLPSEATAVPTPKSWPKCESIKLYKALTPKVDFDAVRKCAWLERSTDIAGVSGDDHFGGSAMLTVLYAKGEGVQQNIPLALRLACEINTDAGETTDRISHLESLRNMPTNAASTFAICDDWEAGMVERECAGYNEDISEQRRFVERYTLSLHWSKQDQSALNALFQAEKAYVDAHTVGDINNVGLYESTVNYAKEQDLLRDNFIEALKYFEKGNRPHSSKDDYKEADARLNAMYIKVIALAEKNKPGEGELQLNPQPEGIRKAERAWIRYRDEWVKFSSLHYASKDPYPWLTLLTNDRIAILQNTLCDLAEIVGGTDDADDDASCSGSSQEPENRFAIHPLP